MRGLVDVLNSTLTHKLLMSSFLGQVTAADLTAILVRKTERETGGKLL